jgi:hypothetical protein
MKTAVEWLVEKILTDVEKYNEDCTKVIGVEYWNAFKDCVDLSEYVNQAKEMEKEQILDARMDGINSALKGYSISNEQYYNETYKKDGTAN